MDPTQQNSGPGIPAVMSQSSPIASVFSTMMQKMFDQLMQQWLANQQANVAGQTAGIGGPGATQPVTLPPAGGGGLPSPAGAPPGILGGGRPGG